MLNLILEICYAQMDVVKSKKNNEKEEKKLNKIIDQAKKYMIMKMKEKKLKNKKMKR